MGTSAASIGLATAPSSTACALVTAWTASAGSLPVPSASSRPRSSDTMARGLAPERSRPRLCIDVPLHLAPLERQRTGVSGLEQLAIHARQQLAQPALVGDGKHDHAGAFFRGKRPIVEVVAIEGHQRASELPRETEMLDVARG